MSSSQSNSGGVSFLGLLALLLSPLWIVPAVCIAFLAVMWLVIGVVFTIGLIWK